MSQPFSWNDPSSAQAWRIATISACAVGSFEDVTWLVAEAITRPSLTMIAAKGLRARSARFLDRHFNGLTHEREDHVHTVLFYSRKKRYNESVRELP